MKYTTWGPKAGCCGHRHSRDMDAFSCMQQTELRLPRHARARFDREVRVLEDDATLPKNMYEEVGKPLDEIEAGQGVASPEECEAEFQKWLGNPKRIG